MQHHAAQQSHSSYSCSTRSHSSQTALTQLTARKLAVYGHCGPDQLLVHIASVLQPLAQIVRKRPIPPADVRIASASDECRYSAARAEVIDQAA